MSVMRDALCLLTVLPFVVTGCRQAPVTPPATTYRTSTSLIGEQPIEQIDRRDWFVEELLQCYTFDSRQAVASWHGLSGVRHELTPEGLRITPSGKEPVQLQRVVDWRSDEVDAVRIDLAGVDHGRLRFFWAGPGDLLRLSEERSVTYEHAPGAEERGHIVLPLLDHAGWRGRISRIRVDPSSGSQPFLISQVCAVRYRPGARLAEATQRPWRVEIDHELRTGYLALPGSPLRLPMTLPAGAMLRVAWGAESAFTAPLTFRVLLEADGERSELLVCTLEPSRPDGFATWQERLLDLGYLPAGSAATLVLETETTGGPEETRGMAFWAGPQLLAPATTPPPPSIVLISIDTLRADHLSLYGYERSTSPNLERWARSSAVVFENVVATSPWTLPSHLSMLSGLDALHHGVNHKGRIPDDTVLLAELLRDAGYTTLAVTGGGFLHPEYGFGQGFDRYRYFPEHTAESELREGTERCLDWLDSHAGQPFFLFLHTYEVHYPYRARQPYFAEYAGTLDTLMADSIGYVQAPVSADNGYLLSKYPGRNQEAGTTTPHRPPFSDADRRLLDDLYDSGIAYTDAHLQLLLERLAALGIDRRTIVAVTSDHGEALGDKGLAGHAYLYDFNLKVPLVLGLAGGTAAGSRIPTQVSSIDILPTLLEAAGLAVPPGIDGLSLLPLINAEGEPRARPALSSAAYANRGIGLRLDNRWKYTFNDSCWPLLQGQERLFDLQADPNEEHNLAGNDATRQLTATLRDLVRAALAEATALRIDLVNPSQRPFRGTLEGGALEPTRVKTAVLPASSLSWTSERSLRFSVQPAGELHLLVLSPIDSQLSIRITGPQGSGPVQLDLGSLHRAWQLVLEEGSWQVRIDDDAWQPTGPAITLTPQGPGTWRQSGDPAEQNDELRRRLQALGYVE